MKTIHTLFFYLIYLSVFSQHEPGIKFSPGASMIISRMNYSDPELQKNFPMPSVQTGFYYNRHTSNNFLFGIEMLFVHISGHEYFKTPFTDSSGNFTGNYAHGHVYRYISYLGIPVYVGFNRKRLNLNLGAQVNFKLASSAKDKGNAFFNGQQHEWENKYNELFIKNFDLGIRAGSVYKLNERFSLDFNYYVGLTNLLPNTDPVFEWVWRVQQMTIGLRYSFAPGKKDNNEIVE